MYVRWKLMDQSFGTDEWRTRQQLLRRPARHVYKLAIVESRRTPGKKTPRQHTVVYLGLLNELYCEVEELPEAWPGRDQTMRRNRERVAQRRVRFWDGIRERLECALQCGLIDTEVRDKVIKELLAVVPEPHWDGSALTVPPLAIPHARRERTAQTDAKRQVDEMQWLGQHPDLAASFSAIQKM
jgi:hypothetical protein